MCNKDFEDIVKRYINEFPELEIQLSLITKMITTRFGTIEYRYCYTAFMYNKKTINNKSIFYSSNYFRENDIENLKLNLIEDIENFVETK